MVFRGACPFVYRTCITYQQDTKFAKNRPCAAVETPVIQMVRGPRFSFGFLDDLGYQPTLATDLASLQDLGLRRMGWNPKT